MANPTALLLSGVMMLRYMELGEVATRIEKSVLGVIRDGKFLTGDLGGTSGTKAFTDEVIKNL